MAHRGGVKSAKNNGPLAHAVAEEKARLKAKTNKPKATFEDLMAQGHKARDSMHPELASQFFARALEMNPDDTSALDVLAEVYAELGDVDKAIPLLQKSIDLSPLESPFKWLLIAQFQEGFTSLESYRKGIELMIPMRDKYIAHAHANGATSQIEMTPPLPGVGDGMESPAKAAAHLTTLIAKAYVSISELYMTDLCYEDDAEQQCQAAIQQSLQIKPDCLDAKQALASLRLSQTRMADAVEIMKGVYMIVKEKLTKMNSRTLIENMTAGEGSSDDSEEEALETPFCIATAKLLIECSAMEAQLADCAMDVIADLLQQDDENLELWYMMGVASMSLQPPDLESGRFHFERAKEMMDEMKESIEKDGRGTDLPPSFEEHYRLCSTHLDMIAEMEEKGEGQAGTKGAKQGGGNVCGGGGGGEVASTSMDQQEDEEWSTCDENEGEDEEDDEAMDS